MTDRLREAAQEALKAWSAGLGVHPRMATALKELRAALAEQDAEQKPAAWIRKDTAITTDAYQASCWRDAHTVTPLYAHPPRREWQSLTDDEIADAIRPLCLSEVTVAALLKCSMDEYRAIEAKLKEKNNG